MATYFYVSTTGLDTNPGTLTQPFATLGKAKAAVESAISGGVPAGGVFVYIRGGIYPITSTFTLSSADSGNATNQITWAAYDAETVRLTGGTTITGWTLATSGNTPAAIWARIKASGIYRASVGITPGTSLMANVLYNGTSGLYSNSKTAGGDPNAVGSISSSAVTFQGDQGVGAWLPHPALAELIYDGSMQTLARWPKRSDDPSVSTSWVTATPTANSLQFTSATDITSRGWSFGSMPTIDMPWAHIIGGGYHDAVVQMTAASATTISTATAEPEGIDGSFSQGRWAAVNMLEEVNTAGDYWIDRTNGVVYFLPPAGDPTSHETVITTLQAPLLWVDNTASYIVFDGLTVEAGQMFLMRVAAPNITIKNSTFRNAGGTGIIVGNTNVTIDRCKFYGLVGSGVSFVGHDVQYMPSTGSASCTIKNSELYRVGRYALCRVPAITLGGGSNHLVQHNYIHDVPNMGIYHLAVSATVEYNIFQRTGLHGFDSGAVYSWNNVNSNNTVRYNIFRDVQMNTTYPGTTNNGYDVVGVYCDDFTTGFTVFANVCYNFIASAAAPTAWASIGMSSKTNGNTYSNNAFLNVDKVFYNGESTYTNGGTWVNNNQSQGENYAFRSSSVNNACVDTNGSTGCPFAVSTFSPAMNNPAGGDFSNNADGYLHLYSGLPSVVPIPVSQIGIIPLAMVPVPGLLEHRSHPGHQRVLTAWGPQYGALASTIFVPPPLPPPPLFPEFGFVGPAGLIVRW